MSKEEGSNPTNPMLYDPIPEGTGEAKKLMQFVAATISKYSSQSIRYTNTIPV